MHLHSKIYQDAFAVLKIREKLEAKSAKELGEDLAKAIIQVKRTAEWLPRAKNDYLLYNKLVTDLRKRLKNVENDETVGDYIKYQTASMIQDHEHEKIKFMTMYKILSDYEKNES